jgi:two-component system, response regulator PdtaR
MKHALIIEDEWLIAAQMQDLLESLGVDTISLAASEEEAIQEARACKPDVITADVRLEAGTGPQAVQRIHAELGPIPVIFVTGNPDAIEPTPAAIVLIKPVSDALLRSAYQRFFPA